MLEDFKKLGLKNKRLNDQLKGKGVRPSKRAKLIEDSQKELQGAQKEVEEQRKLTSYWKKQAQELRGKVAKERQVLVDEHERDATKQSQEIRALKFKLRAEKIE